MCAPPNYISFNGQRIRNFFHNANKYGRMCGKSLSLLLKNNNIFSEIQQIFLQTLVKDVKYLVSETAIVRQFSMCFFHWGGTSIFLLAFFLMMCPSFDWI